VRLDSPALATPLKATVERVGLEVERQSVLASDPAANTDARVVRVLVRIDAPDRDRAARLSGLEVTGRIGATP
jgi:HlyD family secretion protein